MRFGKGMANRPGKKIKNEKHSQTRGDTSDKGASERVGQVCEGKAADVIANIWRHAANHERGEVERPGT